MLNKGTNLQVNMMVINVQTCRTFDSKSESLTCLSPFSPSLSISLFPPPPVFFLYHLILFLPPSSR